MTIDGYFRAPVRPFILVRQQKQISIVTVQDITSHADVTSSSQYCLAG